MNDFAQDEIERLRTACSKQNSEIEQTLGRALGYPQMYEADGMIVAPDYPGAKPIDQVCVGEHVAETLAEEAAKRLEEYRQRVKEISNWLWLNGWAAKRELPDHMAANVKINQVSLADMVYELTEFAEKC